MGQHDGRTQLIGQPARAFIVGRHHNMVTATVSIPVGEVGPDPAQTGQQHVHAIDSAAVFVSHSCKLHTSQYDLNEYDLNTI